MPPPRSKSEGDPAPQKQAPKKQAKGKKKKTREQLKSEGPSLSIRENPSSGRQKVEIHIHEVFEEKDDENSEETAQRTLEQAAAEATFKDMDGRRVMTNDGGQSFLDAMQAMVGEARVSREEHGREISELKTRMGRMENLGNFFMDVRERAFLTYLRDKWRQPEVSNRVRSINRSIVHGGYAEADALMFSERRPTEELRQFIYLYGFPPETILDLATRGLRSTLKVLNAVGGFHLEGKHLVKDEENIYEKIKNLINDGEFDEAEKTSTEFPFEKDFIDVDPIIDME